jgi:RimJ/RimL family protein N-acetyltransferase
MDKSCKEQALATIRQLKEEPAARSAWLPVFQYGRKLGWLEPVTRGDWHQAERRALLAGWLPAAAEILDVNDRLLFWVKGLDEKPVGIVGLAGIDFGSGRVEVDYLVRGVPGVLPGIMYCGLQTLMAWTFQRFAATEIGLRVPADNLPLIRLCDRSGFRDIARLPGSGAGRWVHTMTLSRQEWMTSHRREKAA